MVERYKRKPNTKCSVCENSVYKRPCEVKRNKGNVFCSRVCFGVFCRKENPCLVCGKAILAGLHKKTCGRSCANIHRTGIKYKLNQPRSNVKSQQAVKAKLIMDRGGKCERCAYSIKEVLHTHHKNRNRADNNMSNLELICPNCHYEEHYLEKSWLKNFENI